MYAMKQTYAIAVFDLFSLNPIKNLIERSYVISTW